MSVYWIYQPTPPAACSHLLKNNLLSEAHLPECLVHFSLQKIGRNVPATVIRKWNVTGAMQDIAAAYESIIPIFIQNFS
jgi:hypothetical protein